MKSRAPQNKRNTQSKKQVAVVQAGGIVENFRKGKPLLIELRMLSLGRHLCYCQARIHNLIFNCLGCGKIVCEQEGSGPCLECGTFVCTNDEMMILYRGSRKAAELYKKLTGLEIPPDFDVQQALQSNDALQKATEFRDRLLNADSEIGRKTIINDLEGECAEFDRNPYITQEERIAIQSRRDELKKVREERRKALVVNIDLLNQSVDSVAPDLRDSDPRFDPIIRAILERTEKRRTSSLIPISNANCKVSNGFLPKYIPNRNIHSAVEGDFVGVDELCMMNEEVAACEVEAKAYTISIPQPAAALIANGLLKCYRWHEDLHLKGPLFICANTRSITQSKAIEVAESLASGESIKLLDYSPGTIQGKAYLSDVLTIEEFNEEIGKVDVLGEGKFVLLFGLSSPLRMPIPYVPPSDFFQLDRSLRDALSEVFL